MSASPQPGIGTAGKQVVDGATCRCPQELQSYIGELYDRTEASNFGVSRDQWTVILSEIIDKYLSADADSDSIKQLLEKLRVDELALARACEFGSEKAWEQLLIRYREGLYEAASAMARDDVRGKEIADSLYAELFGISERGGQRSSKLHSYSGIGSLAGWLRTVLAQSFIDRYRYEQKFVEAEPEEIDHFSNHVQVTDTTEVDVDPRVEKVIEQVLENLPREDRLILLCYFLDGQTLAQIANTLHVHVSTISRRIEKITATLRKEVLRGLIRAGMTRAQAGEAMSVDVRDLQVQVRRHLEKTSQQ